PPERARWRRVLHHRDRARRVPQTYRQLRRPAALDQEVIAELEGIASSSTPRHSKASQIADAIRRHGNHRWVGIYDVGPSEISVIAWSGPAAPAWPRFPIDKGLSGAAVKNGRTVIANDV